MYLYVLSSRYKFNCSVRRHIEEGICKSVNIRVGLTGNQTYSSFLNSTSFIWCMCS